MNRTLVVVVLGCAAFGLRGQAVAQERPTVEELQKRYEQLKRRLDEMEAAQVSKKLCQVQREEVIELIKEMSADASKRSILPSWLQDFKIYGDLRLRYEGFCRDYDRRDRNRARFRLRVGVEKTWWDKQLEIGFRLASGEDDEPTTTNQSFTGAFSKKHVWIDLAYARWQPNALKGFTLVGGKFSLKDAWVHTDLIWDSDVNPEGVWAQYKASQFGDFQPFASAGYFIFHEEDQHSQDGIMAQYQVGFDWTIKPVKWTCALTYYDYDHYDTRYVAAGGNHVGPDGNLQDFQMINLTNKVGWKVDVGGRSIPMAAYFDWVHNCKDDDPDHGWNDQSDGYAAGLKIGQNSKKGDWSFSYKYAYLEANCTPSYLCDSDFGGANRKGHVFAVVYNLDTFLTVGAQVYHTEPVTGASQNNADTRVRADLIWKF